MKLKIIKLRDVGIDNMHIPPIMTMYPYRYTYWAIYRAMKLERLQMQPIPDYLSVSYQFDAQSGHMVKNILYQYLSRGLWDGIDSPIREVLYRDVLERLCGN